jgi:hypothetical protein
VLRIERWKRSRFWAVWEGETLVAVCVYRRGAAALVSMLEERRMAA